MALQDFPHRAELVGMLLNEPDHRLLHVVPRLDHIREMLVVAGYLDKHVGKRSTSYTLTPAGLLAQALIKEASPRRRHWRHVNNLWLRLWRPAWAPGQTNVQQVSRAKALVTQAISKAHKDRLIEPDPDAPEGEVWRWRA